MDKEAPTFFKTDEREFRVHQLKTIEPYYSAVVSGNKTFEVRKFDRDFQVGDFLMLTHYDIDKDRLGESVYKIVTYILTDKPYVLDGYVILGMTDGNIILPFN